MDDAETKTQRATNHGSLGVTRNRGQQLIETAVGVSNRLVRRSIVALVLSLAERNALVPETPSFFYLRKHVLHLRVVSSRIEYLETHRDRDHTRLH